MQLLDYLALFPGASREKERFMALAELVLRQVMDLADAVSQIPAAQSIDGAVGVQLDDLAASFGLSRADAGNNVSDETFREYIRMKLQRWAWDGTNRGVKAALSQIPGGSQTDNQNGTVTGSYTGTLPAAAKELFPVPAGIRIR